MANVKSDLITNADATPVVFNNDGADGAMLRLKQAYVAKGAETDGSTWRFFRIPSNALISSLHYSNTAIAGFTSITIGLYDTAAAGGAAVSAALFGTAVDMHTAVGWTDATFLVTTQDLIEKRVWELLSLSADPNKHYDVVLTGTTAGTNTGKLAMKISYTV